MAGRVELFEAIRRDHRREQLSVRALAARYGVHRRTVRQALASACPPARKPADGLEYRILTWPAGYGCPFRSRCDLILAGEPVEDRSTANLVVGQVDHLRGLGLGLGRCELCQCLVWPRGIEVVEVDVKGLP